VSAHGRRSVTTIDLGDEALFKFCSRLGRAAKVRWMSLENSDWSLRGDEALFVFAGVAHEHPRPAADSSGVDMLGGCQCHQ